MKTNPSHFYNGKDDYLLAKACEVTGVTRVTTSRHRNGNLLSREGKMAASRFPMRALPTSITPVTAVTPVTPHACMYKRRKRGLSYI